MAASKEFRKCRDCDGTGFFNIKIKGISQLTKCIICKGLGTITIDTSIRRNNKGKKNTKRN